MIGEPTNFVHLTHIGSGEMADGMQPVRHVLLAGTVGLSHFNVYGMAIIYNDRTNASMYSLLNLLVIPDCHRHTLQI